MTIRFAQREQSATPTPPNCCDAAMRQRLRAHERCCRAHRAKRAVLCCRRCCRVVRASAARLMFCRPRGSMILRYAREAPPCRAYGTRYAPRVRASSATVSTANMMFIKMMRTKRHEQKRPAFARSGMPPSARTGAARCACPAARAAVCTAMAAYGAQCVRCAATPRKPHGSAQATKAPSHVIA